MGLADGFADRGQMGLRLILADIPHGELTPEELHDDRRRAVRLSAGGTVAFPLTLHCVNERKTRTAEPACGSWGFALSLLHDHLV